DVGLDDVVELHGTEGVGDGAELYAVDFRVDGSECPCQGQGSECDFSEVAPCEGHMLTHHTSGACSLALAGAGAAYLPRVRGRGRGAGGRGRLAGARRERGRRWLRSGGGGLVAAVVFGNGIRFVWYPRFAQEEQVVDGALVHHVEAGLVAVAEEGIGVSFFWG